jgi:hypothetical protein
MPPEKETSEVRNMADEFDANQTVGARIMSLV